MTATPLLDIIDNMDDLRRLPEGELQRLAAELRDATIGAALRAMPGLDEAGTSSSSQCKTSS